MSEREGDHYRGDHVEFRDSDIHGEVTGVRYEHHHHYSIPTQPAAPTEPPGRLIGHVNALDLEVHPAIDAGAAVAGLDVLPAYIPRAHDETLSDLVTQVEKCGDVRMQILVGGSSTGKTRACWEAVHRLPAPWRLWHPLRPDRPEALLAGMDHVVPYTVVWLNEAQHYLLTPNSQTGKQAAAALRELLASPGRGPVLILGTLWPDYWDLFTAVSVPSTTDLHAQARELLKGVTLRMPEAFTNADVQAATCGVTQRDPRLVEALEQAHDGAVTQYLAGGPALIERYDGASIAARALVHAAMDARRLGHSPALPRLMLEEAAAGYLSDRQWDLLADDWLERAFAYLTDPLPCRGARALLTRIKTRPGFSSAGQSEGEPSYRLADYLEQHGARTRRPLCPPAEFWNAATRHASPGDQDALAQSAYDRCRYRHAFTLWQAAAMDDVVALQNLKERRERGKNNWNTDQLYQAAADASAVTENTHRFHSRADAGPLFNAILAKVSGQGIGNTFALQDLMRRWKGYDGKDGVERLARAAADTSDNFALRTLVRSWEGAGDKEGAEALARAAADVGNTSALQELAEMRERTGDRQSAERLARAAADAGNTSALQELVRRREKSGDGPGAERLARLAAYAGDTSALRNLAEKWEANGDESGAGRLYREAADAGDTSALRSLARRQERAGDVRDAERLYRKAADAGNISALQDLAEIREEEGDKEGAEWLAREAANVGDTSALQILAERREITGDGPTAEQLAREVANTGNTSALQSLARRRERAGDAQGAERLVRVAADAGDILSLRRLAEMREWTGDRHGAERLARAAADAGHPFILRSLAMRWEQNRADGRWGDLLRFGLEADGRIANPWQDRF